MKTISKYILVLAEYTLCSVLLFLFCRDVLNPDVLSSFYRMYPYHASHPIAFIKITVVALFIALFSRRLLCLTIKSVWGRYLLFYLWWIVLACALGGALWSYYDMEAGWYPEGYRLYSKIVEDTKAGIGIGPIIIATSLPYNFLVLIASLLILKWNKVLVREN